MKNLYRDRLNRTFKFSATGLFAFSFALITALAAIPAAAGDYVPSDYVWTSPSQNSAGSMPCGGHDVGMNVWVEDGDVMFYSVLRQTRFEAATAHSARPCGSATARFTSKAVTPKCVFGPMSIPPRYSWR